jgi:hypothetical protein
MIKKIVLASSLPLGIFFSACGGGGGTEDMINTYKLSNDYGYYGDLVLFKDTLISGMWSEYRYDENGSIQQGMQMYYTYDNNGIKQMRVVVDTIGIDTGWAPLGEYGVDEDGSNLSFQNGFYEYVEYTDDINDTNMESNRTCMHVNYYTTNDVNGTQFQEKILMCKDY